MKSYSTIIPGKKMSQFVELPEEFQECDLKVLVKPILKKKETGLPENITGSGFSPVDCGNI